MKIAVFDVDDTLLYMVKVVKVIIHLQQTHIYEN